MHLADRCSWPLAQDEQTTSPPAHRTGLTHATSLVMTVGQGEPDLDAVVCGPSPVSSDVYLVKGTVFAALLRY